MKVSIIIPTYNYGRFITETIQALQQQTHTNWEAIIVDDGSTDKTNEIISPLLKEDARLLYYKQDNNGVSAARNFGLTKASGNFIQFLDADDFLSTDKLKLQLAYFQKNPTVDICYTDNHYFLDGQKDKWYPDLEMRGNEWLPHISGSGQAVLKILLQHNISVISSPLFRKEVLEKVHGFDQNLKHTEDWKFWFACAFAGFSFHYLNHKEAYTLIRVHNSSVSQNVITMQYGEMKMRTWVDVMLKQMPLSEKEINQMVKHNKSRKNRLVKHVMYHTDVWDIKHLKTMAEVAGWPSVILYIIKSLNYKRKVIRDAKKNRHHHFIKG